MMRFNSSEIRSGRTILLAPPLTRLIRVFNSVQEDYFRHHSLLAEAQRLRGRLYLQDGAIEAEQLSEDGRFVHIRDDQSWHLLVMDRHARVAGCLRYSPSNPNASFFQLEVARSALAHSDEWGVRLRRAVEAKRADARRRGIDYAELGGWALNEEMRVTGEALRMALTIYALAQLLGGTLAMTTATVRHHSSTILRRIGGEGLFQDGIELPSYYDPYYNCEMEILTFDSLTPNPRYEAVIDECRQHLKNLTVISADSICPDWGISQSISTIPAALGPVPQEASKH